MGRRLRAHLGIVAAASLSLAAAALAVSGPPQLPLPTTLLDFKQPGTQPILGTAILSSDNCTECHQFNSPDEEPYARWASSMMAQATRDPVFRAALSVAEQDAAFSGDLCLRCHAAGGWLAGRSEPTNGSGLQATMGDFDGVTCHLCHRMVDPVYTAGSSPMVDQGILNALPNVSGVTVPVTPSSGQYVIDPSDRRRGPYDDLGAAFSNHDWLASPYHRESRLCGTCHDVSNPTLSKQNDGTFKLNAVNAPHPTQNLADEFPIERTFSEWSKSHFARRKIDLGGRFGGNINEVGTCQDCHLPKTDGDACAAAYGPIHRNDLPQHDFNGSNSWVLRAVHALFPRDETGLTDASVDDSVARNESMLRRAADLRAWVRTPGVLAVRVVNQTGHKLPTGYPEGRRMWLNVRFFDGGGWLIEELGEYSSPTARLDTQTTRVYEVFQGLDDYMAGQTGLAAGKSFHFVLNNKVLKDNRIPPRGFANAAFAGVLAEPVAATYAEEQYWDDAPFGIPNGAVSAVIRLYHQTTTLDYIDFLKQENHSDDFGDVAYQQWFVNGKSEPVLMAEVELRLDNKRCVPPIPYGLAKVNSAGTYPELFHTGTPNVVINNFQLVVRAGKPGQTGILFSSGTSATTPFHGGTLLLGPPLVRERPLQLDAQGRLAMPIAVTPAMAGTSRNYQVFLRDLGLPDPFGLTNAVHVEFCP